MSKAVLFATVCLLIAPGRARAQISTGNIAGTVKDATGAVLPGVTVEASSPALIERVRSVVTDATGQYKIVELQPGTYAVTFGLQGFNTLKREGIQLTSGFTATVNADLTVGQMTETLTVSGQAPVIDVQNVREAAVLPRDVVDRIPTGKEFQNLGALVPGMVVNSMAGAAAQDVGGQAGQSHAIMNIHGGRASDQKLFLDGMNILGATAPGTNGFHFTDGNYEEYVLDVAASSAEQETGGVRINMVPRDGGNTFRGTFFGNFANNSLAGSNITDALRTAGLTAPNNVKTLLTVNPTLGGPIREDRLWFFATATRTETDTYIGGTYYNRTAGTPFYTPDLTSQAVDDFWANDAALRLTWQATPRNKFTLYYDYNLNCHCHFYVSPTVAPDAANHMTYLTHVILATWSSPVTNRLLLEAGVTTYPQRSRWDAQQGSAGPAVTDIGRGLTYGNATLGRNYYDEPGQAFRASMSYVTGAHAAKVGIQVLTHEKSQLELRDTNYAVTVLNGTPVQVAYYPTPATDTAFLRPDLGVYAQDQWTLHRLTLNAGLRFDYLRYGYDDTTLQPTPNIPTTRLFPALIKGDFRDLSPRLGAVYDLFGDGKTALKASVSRYVGVGMSSVSGAVSALGSDPRRWTDSNGNLIPDGDPTNPLANGEIGPSTNGRFAQAYIPLRYDPGFFGFGTRPLSNWEFSTGVQHELLPRVSVSAAYFRRLFTTFQVTDNAAVTGADYSPFCVTAPSDPRLPGGGGYRVCGLYDLNPPKVGQSDPVVASAGTFGNQYEHWSGVDLAMNARLPRGALLQAGFSTGKTMTDDCAIVAGNPQVQAVSSVGTTYSGITSGPSVSTQFCHIETPFLSQVKALGAYTLPWDVQVSGTLQNVPGPLITANAVFTSAQVAQSLGRPLSAASTVTVNVVKPGTLYGERMNQVDLRLSKIFRLGPRRLEGMFDLYNLLNQNAIVQVNNTYGTNGAAWLVPQRILPARLIKFGVQVNF
jgi:hypothetical protein